MLPTTIEIAASAASAGCQLSTAGPERDLEEAHEDAERGRLGRHRHERGDRRRSALVDVRRPLVEGGDRDLEREPGGGEPDPDQDQRVVGEPGADPVADAVKSVEPRAP